MPTRPASSLGYASQIVGSFGLDILAGYTVTHGGRTPDHPEPRVWFNPDLKSSNFMVPGVVALVLMIITMTLTSLGIVKEKEIGTLEQLMVTPIRPYQLIIGKLIPFTIIGFIDMVIVLAIARFWFGVPLRGEPAAAVRSERTVHPHDARARTLHLHDRAVAAAGDADRPVLLLHAVHLPVGIRLPDREHARPSYSTSPT